MENTFEDEFMNIQIGMVSLCLEAFEDIDLKVDKVYIYAFCNEHQTFFNAFFEYNSRILSFEELGVSDYIISQVFDLGMEDTERIVDLCNEYRRKAPNQFKLIYDTNTKKFDSSYDYDNLDNTELGCAEVFTEWENEIKNK